MGSGAQVGAETRWDVSEASGWSVAGDVELPPGFALAAPPPGQDPFAYACEAAEALGAGTLVWARGSDQLDVAVVLEPEEPLATARRAFLIGMSALVDAVASVAPPDKTLTLDWPDAIRFDGARLGGGRLGLPTGAREEDVPPYLVFGGSLILSKSHAGDPGLTPDSTSFEEEGFEPGSDVAIIEAFARYLMRGFHAWREDSFEAAVAGFLTRLRRPGSGSAPVLNGVGDLVSGEGGGNLAAALRAPAWLERDTRMVRL